MKRILFLIFLVLSLNSFSQQSAYPATSLPELRDNVSGKEVNPDALVQNQVIRFSVPVYNTDLVKPLHPGSYQLRINFGSGIISSSDIATAGALGNYIKWTSSVTDGRQVITGDIIADIPANFADAAVFTFKCKTAGEAVITMEWVHLQDKLKKADPKIVTSLHLKVSGVK